MVHCSMKKYLNVVLLLLLHLSNAFSYMWTDEKADNQLYDDLELYEQKFINKNKRIEASTPSQDEPKRFHNNMLNSALIPMYKTTNHNRCNCEMNFRPVDLGHSYYPRYLHSGFCQPNSCEKYYQCVEKKYYVKVLRKKEFKDGEDAISSSSLPKALRNVWTAETIPVGVACECVIDF